MIPVLIVEDEFLVRVGLRSMINWEEQGFCVVGDASNGEKGLELFKEHRPFLVLTDIKMAPMDGLEMMREIRKLDENVRFIVISAYDEFKYAQEAIRYGVELYLNKASFTNQEIVTALERIRKQYEKCCSGTQPAQAGTIRDFFDVFPANGDPQELTPLLNRLGFEQKKLVLVACRHDRSCVLPENRALAVTILSDLFQSFRIVFQLYRSHEFLIALADGSEPQTLDDCLEHICKTLENYTNSHLYFGISSPFSDGGRLYVALSEARQACNEFIFDKAVPMRRYSGPQAAAMPEDVLKSGCEEIENRLLSGDRETVLLSLGKLVDSAKGNYHNLERAVFYLLLTLEKYDASLIVSEMLSAAMKCDDLDRLCSFLGDWMKKMPGEEPNLHNNDIRRIVVYIQENLTEDLSLKPLAGLCHLSPNYFSKLFYQQTGVYLTNYVSNCRLNRACELIRETDFSIGEIGRMVGIEDPHYFSKFFKDRMGMSPHKYRQKKDCCGIL